MPAILICDWQGRTTYEENDVIAVLPVRHEFGVEELRLGRPDSEKIFAYVYCTDIVPNGPLAQRLLEVNQDYTIDPETGEQIPVPDAGEFKKRRWQLILANFPGNVTRFLTHEPWGDDGSTVPLNKKYTWQELRQWSRGKRVSDTTLPAS